MLLIFHYYYELYLVIRLEIMTCGYRLYWLRFTAKFIIKYYVNNGDYIVTH